MWDVLDRLPTQLLNEIRAGITAAALALTAPDVDNGAATSSAAGNVAKGRQKRKVQAGQKDKGKGVVQVEAKGNGKSKTQSEQKGKGKGAG